MAENKKKSIPLAAVDRIMRSRGAKRIRKNAAKELRDMAEDFVIEITEAAMSLVAYREKVMITKEDVKEAMKQMRRWR